MWSLKDSGTPRCTTRSGGATAGAPQLESQPQASQLPLPQPLPFRTPSQRLTSQPLPVTHAMPGWLSRLPRQLCGQLAAHGRILMWWRWPCACIRVREGWPGKRLSIAGK